LLMSNDGKRRKSKQETDVLKFLEAMEIHDQRIDSR
jgi:hypothetical protein